MKIARAGLDIAKIGLSGSRRRRCRPCGYPPAVSAQSVAQFLQQTAGLHYRNRGMLERASLARELTRLRHEVRLIPPQYVKPYVKEGLNKGSWKRIPAMTMQQPVTVWDWRRRHWCEFAASTTLGGQVRQITPPRSAIDAGAR